MNWDAISTVAEVVGALAVVVTLLYLAVQIRQNTIATHSGTSSYIDEALARFLSAVREDSEFAEIWLKGCADIESLNQVERVRFISHLLELLNLAEYVHQLETQGLSRTHIDLIPWVALLYRDNPGIRSFVDGMDNVGSPELTYRIKDVTGARGTNFYGSEVGPV